MTERREGELYYDPYDFEIDADPYPVWRRMRDEAPLYYNERHDFYALSRFDDVEGVHHRLEDLHLGQGLGPRDHPERDGDPARDHPLRGPARPTTCTGACSPGLHTEADGRHRAAGAEFCARASTRWWRRAGSTSSAIWRPRCRCGPSACCSGSPRTTRRRSVTGSTRACGSRRAGRPSVEDLGPLDGSRYARVHRLAGRAPLRRPHDRPAQRRVRGRHRDGPQADPGRDPQLRQPARRRRQRDDHPADRLDRQGAGRAPRPAPRAGRGPGADPQRHRGAAALRAALAGPGPLRHPRRRALRPDRARGQRAAAAERRGQPRRAQVRGPRPLRHPPQIEHHLTFGYGIHFCLGATWPGSRAGSRWTRC